MSEKKKHIKPDREAFRRYLSDQMSDSERHAFERELEKDPIASEALEGLEGLNGDDFSSEMGELEQRLKRRSIPVRAFSWYRMAAAIAVIGVIGTLLYTLVTQQDQEMRKELAVSEEKTEMKDGNGDEGIMDEGSPASVPETTVKKEHVTTIKTEAKTSPVVRPDMNTIEDPETLSDIENGVIEEREVTVEYEIKKATKKSAVSEISGISAGAPVMEAQRALTGKVSGIVVSEEDHKPLPGAVIRIRGIGSGTVTDSQGRFNMNVADSTAELEASFIGLETASVSARAGEELTIYMEPSLATLEEVVVTGYGHKAKQDMTGSVSKVEVSSAKSKPAEPSGGWKAFNTYIKSSIRFPDEDTLSTRVVVVLEFGIENTGRPYNIREVRSPGSHYTRIATELLENGPSWQPSETDGVVYPEGNRIRIIFRR